MAFCSAGSWTSCRKLLIIKRKGAQERRAAAVQGLLRGAVYWLDIVHAAPIPKSSPASDLAARC
jgi:hypothetical protein